MTVGVLLMTHESMGAALVGAARHVLGRLPLSVEVQEVAANADPDQMLRTAAANARGDCGVVARPHQECVEMQLPGHADLQVEKRRSRVSSR